MHVAIVCYDGVDELDVVGPFRVLVGAADAGESVQVSLVTVEPTETVTASHGLTFAVDGTLDAVDPDILLVPGGGWNTRAERGAWAEAQRGTIPETIRDFHAQGGELAGVCTGTMLLAESGLLEGRPAVTHAGAMEDLHEGGAEPVDERVVDDGDIVTAGGVTAGLDLGLHLLEREFGAALAEQVAASIEYEAQSSRGVR